MHKKKIFSIKYILRCSYAKFGMFFMGHPVYSVPAHDMAKHRTKFGWPLLSDVAAARKPRRETRWNLLGYPKLTNRYQLLVGHSSPYCEDMSRRYSCLTSFFPIVNVRLSCEDIAQQSFAIVCRWRIFVSCTFRKPRADIQSATTENRRGKRRRNNSCKIKRLALLGGHKYTSCPNWNDAKIQII